eukprot:Skav227305  [mRNA]  locus=scaffold2645:304397:305724:- [translate_table: standard]
MLLGVKTQRDSRQLFINASKKLLEDRDQQSDAKRQRTSLTSGRQTSLSCEPRSTTGRSSSANTAAGKRNGSVSKEREKRGKYRAKSTPVSVQQFPEQDRLRLRADGAHMWEGSYTVFGYQFLFNRGSDKEFLPCSKKSLKAWKKRQPSKMRLPVPEEVIFALGTVMLEQGHLMSACAMALQYQTYLRPSEVITLQHHQLCPPVRQSVNVYDQWAVVLFPQSLETKSKTGENNESIIIENLHHPWISAMLSLLHHGPRRSPLFKGLTLSLYERHFEKAMKQLALPLTVTPHVIRHSGPSNDFYHRRKTLKQIQRQGRWAAVASVRRYEKGALLMQSWGELSAAQTNQVTALARLFPSELQKALKRMNQNN